jgi:hypothetical protein
MAEEPSEMTAQMLVEGRAAVITAPSNPSVAGSNPAGRANSQP